MPINLTFDVQSHPFNPPVVIGGEVETFRTRCPAVTEVRPDHPRLLIDSDTRAILDHPLYGRKASGDIGWGTVLHNILVHRDTRNDPLQCAFRCWYTGDDEAVELMQARVKRWASDPETVTTIDGPDKQGYQCSISLIYDWSHDVLNTAERRQLFDSVIVAQGRDPRDGGGFFEPWNNNRFSGHGGSAHPWYALAGLAGHGDASLRHDQREWCADVVRRCRDGDDLVWGPYSSARGEGLLDVLNLMSLDSGGCQMGDHGAAHTGYSGMASTAAPIVFRAWETATGETLIRRCSFFENAPQWWWYEHDWRADTYLGRFLMATLTREPSFSSLTRGLAKRKMLEGKHRNVWDAVLSDFRVPKADYSEAEARWPAVDYLRGMDLWYSRQADTLVRCHVLCGDFSRIEPSSGALSYRVAGEPVLVDGELINKGWANHQTHSAVWASVEHSYWSPHRAGDTRTCLTNPVRYLPQHMIRHTPQSARFHCAGGGIRTVDHAGRQLVIHDELSTVRAINYRLPADPVIEGLTASLTIGDVSATLTASSGRWHWAGGEGHEWDDWLGNRSAPHYPRQEDGYSVDPLLARRLGRGNLFLLDAELNVTVVIDSELLQ